MFVLYLVIRGLFPDAVVMGYQPLLGSHRLAKKPQLTEA
jgi:hypothetical protein